MQAINSFFTAINDWFVALFAKVGDAFVALCATVFKPNAIELQAAIPGPLRTDDDEWLAAARQRFGCEHLLVTLGERGMVLRSENESFRIPTTAREVYDVSGAGDTVTACLAVFIAAGQPS